MVMLAKVREGDEASWPSSEDAIRGFRGRVAELAGLGFDSRDIVGVEMAGFEMMGRRVVEEGCKLPRGIAGRRAWIHALLRTWANRCPDIFDRIGWGPRVRFALTPEAAERVKTQAAVRGYVLWYARTLHDAVFDEAGQRLATEWVVTRPVGRVLCVERGGAEFLTGAGTWTGKHADIDRLWLLVRTAHEKYGNVSRADLRAVVRDAQRRAGTVGGKEDLEASMLILRNSGKWLFAHGKRGLRANKRLVRELLGGTEPARSDHSALDALARACDSDEPRAAYGTIDAQTADPGKAAEAIDDYDAQTVRVAAEVARKERLIRQASEEARAAGVARGARGLEGAIAYVAECYRGGSPSRRVSAKLAGVTAKALLNAETRYVRPAFERAFG